MFFVLYLLSSLKDYGTFGAPMPGRSYVSSTGYRYGWNTQEKVDEISGSGNHNTAMFWEYDTRLGRRWNLDPKPTTGISDYAAMANNPIWLTDHYGDKPKDVIKDIKGWFNRNIRHRTSDGRFKLMKGATETHWILETKTETIVDERRNLLGTTLTVDKKVNLSSQENVSDYQLKFTGVYSWANQELSMNKGDIDEPLWVSDRRNKTSPILPNIKNGYGIHFSHTYPAPGPPAVFTDGNSTTSVAVEVIPTLQVTFQVRKLVTSSPAWFRAIETRTEKGKEKNYSIDD